MKATGYLHNQVSQTCVNLPAGKDADCLFSVWKQAVGAVYKTA